MWISAIGLAVGGLALALIFARKQGDSYDAGIMAQVAQSIVKEHNFVVHDDIFHFNMPYASYGIGMSLLMVPAFIVGPAIHVAPERLYAAINAALFGLTLAVLFGLGISLGASRRQAVIAAIGVGLGTPLLVYGATSFSELGTGLGVAVSFLGVQLAGRRPAAGSALAGAGSGFALLMRPESLALVIPIAFGAAWFAGGRRWRPVIGFGLAVLPALAITAVYNAVRFGRPDQFGYSGFTIFDHPFLAGLYGLVLSPGRGLILYAPIVVVAAVGVPFAWQRSRALTAACVLLLAARIVFFAPYFAWNGGTSWGPRFLVPALPVLLPPTLEVVRRFWMWPRAAQAAILAVALLSISVQIVGASVKVESEQVYVELGREIRYAPDYSDFQKVYTSRSTQDVIDRALFDYRYFPIADHASKLARGEDLNGHVPAGSVTRTFVVLVVVSLLGFVVALLPVRKRNPRVAHAA